jgi:hypothetical protein
MKILDVPQSGSVAGVTSSRNRYGQYRRTRAIPVQPQTQAQLDVRANLSSLSAAWRGLDANKQSAWRSLAQSYPYTDSLGQIIILTGHQLYIAINSIRLLGAQATTDDAPAIPDTFLTDPMTGLTAEIAAGTTSLNVTWATIPATEYALLYASPPLSPGVGFWNDFRLIGVRQGATGAQVDYGAAYDAKFGAPQAGQKVLVRAIHCINGFRGPKKELNDIWETTS